MSKYRVSGSVVGVKWIGEFEAGSPEEAEEKAWDSDECNISLCHQCSSECEDGEIDELFVELIEK